MKINSLSNPVESGGLIESTSFKVEMNAMMFHSVIDGIYADKIRSPFRELCTNARDSHVVNGNLDQPFDVILPSRLNPIFKVRDYGTGLSHEDVMGLYTTMFASSKRDSNEAVGMIGLGSKSPFAYTSAFTVTSFFGGRQTVYSAYIGESGVPQIAVMNQIESSDPTGIEISMPVQMKDVDSFRQAANDVLFGFEPYPNVINETWVKTEYEVAFQGKDWRFYRSAPFTAPMARQGCVLYPISPTALGEKLPNLYDKSSPSVFWRWPLVIDFAIGELDVATSREALGYTPKTLAALKEKIAVVRTDMGRVLSDDLRSSDTYLDACILYSKTVTASGSLAELWSTLGSNITYNGRAVVRNFQIPARNNEWQMDLAPGIGAIKSVFSAGVKFRSDRMYNESIWPDKMKAAVVAVEWEDCNFAPSRIRTLMDLRSEAKGEYPIIWVRPTSKAGLDAFLHACGHPTNVVDLSTVERKSFSPRTKTEKHIRRLRYLEVMPVNRQYPYAAMYEAANMNSPILYIEQREKLFYPRGIEDTHFNLDIFGLHSTLFNAVGLNLISVGTKIYFTNGALMDVDKTKLPMVPLHQHLKQQILLRPDLKDIARYSTNTVRASKVSVAKFFLDQKVDAPKDLTDVMTRVSQVDTTLPTILNNASVKLMRDFAGKELDELLVQSDKVFFEYDEIVNKYPLFEFTLRHTEKLSHYMELLKK